MISNAQFASWHGFILEKLGLYQQSAVAFERSLYLFSDLSEVHISQFYYLVNALKSIKDYCGAIATIQMYVSYDPADRYTTEIKREIGNLRNRGNCPGDTVTSKKNVTLKRKGGVLLVRVKVNGVVGSFILDTGASTVLLTSEFAEKANINLNRKKRVWIRGVVGTQKDYMGYAKNIS